MVSNSYEFVVVCSLTVPPDDWVVQSRSNSLRYFGAHHDSNHESRHSSLSGPRRSTSFSDKDGERIYERQTHASS